MQIGMFTREANGFTGQIHTLTLACDLAIIPAEPSETENAPDYRVHQGSDEGRKLARAGCAPANAPASTSRLS